MKTRLAALPIVALVALVACASAGAAMVAIYRNALDTTAQRSEMLKLTGRACARGGSEATLKVTVGKATEECVYRTPVQGRNLEIAATERLLSGTPAAVAKKAFLGLVLRAGGGAKYELRVFSGQKKVQLVKMTKEGGVEYLAIKKKVAAVKGLNEANVLRLKVEGAKGKVVVTGYLGPEVVGEASDEAAAVKSAATPEPAPETPEAPAAPEATAGPEVEGESSGVAVGAPTNGSGAIATFDAIVVRAPVRF
jgi:hypothetical protein